MSNSSDRSTGSLSASVSPNSLSSSGNSPESRATPVDILILSNGPGEVSTWVRPLVQALRQQLGHDRRHVRISLVLSPCPHASGQEVAIARQYGEIDRIQGARDFWPFLIRGKTAERWDWRDRGVVVFLGGDQLFPIIIGKRLGYRIVIYGEWDTRWHRWGDRYAAMNHRVLAKVSRKYHAKFTIVGDLMADLPTPPLPHSPTPPLPHSPTLAFLPGSKAAKLAIGMPFTLGIMDCLHRQRPDIEATVFVAPGLSLRTLCSFGQRATNPLCHSLNSPEANLVIEPDATGEDQAYLDTPSGARLRLHTDFPAYDRLRQCDLSITTVGANTAELGALGIPMLVLMPMHQMDAMRSWDGLAGLLARLPGVGQLITLIMNYGFVWRKPLVAWPNIWAGREIVPELLGKFTPDDIAAKVLDYLDHPELLATMRDRLQQVRGQPGAGQAIAQIIAEIITEECQQ
ncbi:MAG: lipid-A-disaccharide synthase [Leptolyngbyaceae bacterium]|nr:lipid-A-disaccharide synthase [Leptolyngbyaceae bacterium]